MSVFADDWRDCLRAQFRYVIQQQDHHTEESLAAVMLDMGFSEDELHALRLEASIRAEDMPDDFVPEEVLASVSAPGVDVPPEARRGSRLSAGSRGHLR